MRQSLFLVEFVGEEANITTCQSPAERFHLPVVPAKKKNIGWGERDREAELWVGNLELKLSLATALLWAVSEAAHPLQSVTSRACGRQQ